MTVKQKLHNRFLDELNLPVHIRNKIISIIEDEVPYVELDIESSPDQGKKLDGT